MLLEVVSLVRRFVPGLLQRSRPSVACVRTTRAKYLVFDDNSRQPVCVVQFGSAERLLRIDRILRELHHRMPTTIPASLCCAPLDPSTYIHIQQGLPGMPWFRIRDGVRTPSDWPRLLDRAVATMNQMHSAVREVPEWLGTIKLQDELHQQQAKLAESKDALLKPMLLRRLSEWGEAFDGDISHTGIWQHGDFSLNNLLVSPDSVAIIDFDDFGYTRMPLHDAFGLALSFILSQGTRCPLSRADCIKRCVEQALREKEILRNHCPALLLHHLLWRINQCHGLEQRSTLHQILLSWLEQLVHSPETFLHD